MWTRLELRDEARREPPTRRAWRGVTDLRSKGAAQPETCTSITGAAIFSSTA
eukprot:CAMPEP_0183499114 /NCGR_PEP_ID=MMETSP0371-20130417/1379_1 /TAXON_ID=268820 /ORGANISM="Peridinium aciculiferum, Strain PAER-2" /LENGTH=51 /DNA_ID=CAMNT_0025692815 /DNA_START=106 /DNA_END=258 /DNA_ORIENTATION=-